MGTNRNSLMLMGIAIACVGCAAPALVTEPPALVMDPVATADAIASPEVEPPPETSQAHTTKPVEATKPVDPVLVEAPDLDAVQDRWGIRILGLRTSAAGHFLDFRYRVTDPDKATPLFDRRHKPYLLDERSGKAVSTAGSPKIGPLRNSDKPIADRIFFVVFGNPGKLIGPGSTVSLVIGEFRVDHLTVQ